MCFTGILMTKTIMNSFSIRAKGYTNLFVFLQLGNANLFAIFFLFISKLFSFSNPIVISFFWECYSIFSQFYSFKSSL